MGEFKSPNSRQSFGELRHDHDLRGLAMEVVVQLPKDQNDALRVLDYARSLVTDFLGGTDREVSHPTKNNLRVIDG